MGGVWHDDDLAGGLPHLNQRVAAAARHNPVAFGEDEERGRADFFGEVAGGEGMAQQHADGKNGVSSLGDAQDAVEGGDEHDAGDRTMRGDKGGHVRSQAAPEDAYFFGGDCKAVGGLVEELQGVPLQIAVGGFSVAVAEAAVVDEELVGGDGKGVLDVCGDLFGVSAEVEDEAAGGVFGRGGVRRAHPAAQDCAVRHGELDLEIFKLPPLVGGDGAGVKNQPVLRGPQERASARIKGGAQADNRYKFHRRILALHLPGKKRGRTSRN